jgi:multidrug resistance efflux pump
MSAAFERNRLYTGAHGLRCAEAFLAKQGTSRPYVYWAALILCTGALVALPIVKVDVSVQERGRVRPASERSAIVARTAGIISSVQVHDNELVRAGDTLVTLNSRALQAKLDLNASQTELVQKELADLSYLLDYVSNKRPVLVNDLQTAKYISDFQKFDTECRNADLALSRSEREMSRTKQLFADKVVASRDLEQSSYEANAARVQREIISRQVLAQWQADKVQKQIDLDQLKAEARQLTEDRSLYLVKAPVDGTVIGLEGVFEGSYVQSGQRIGDISPTSDSVIDVSVPPKDIGRIFKGQPVNIQVEAYPYTVWGLLPGRVIRISADYVQEGDTTSAFKVVVRPDRDFLETREGLRGRLKKGMTVNARFLVARHSLWELLYESLDQSFNPVLNQEQLERDRAR